MLSVLGALAALPALPHTVLCPFAWISPAGCPTCGTTRSLWMIVHGRYGEAWRMNPLGYMCFGIFLIRLACASSDQFKSRLRNSRIELALLTLFLVVGVGRWIVR
jgi:hypothetical protein